MNYKSLMKTDAGWGITVLRVVTGIVYMGHGWPKFGNLEGSAGFLASKGIPLANIMAPLVASVEFVGGAMLVLGLLTRVISALQAFTMLVAVLLVHLSNGMFGEGGYQWALLIMAASVCMMLEGGGKASLDTKLS